MKQRKRNRMPGFDYSRNKIYFVTTNTRQFIPYFGVVRHGQMQLNTYGQIARQQWDWLLQHYAYIISHAFVVMPNHVHALIEIDSSLVQSGLNSEENAHAEAAVKIKSVSEIIGAYKSTTSKAIHAAGCATFIWHRSFHDIVIRHMQDYENIKRYIITNPQRWKAC